ncbi:recombination mediator RecR [Coxiella endosymbiont of Amblyomma americanum]|uniref:recombination mediator RecR n=1 Tax=Coxiella endosymbiont of Amblyomma americanum TaxID=325775 RepID=UPI00057DA065|nr:recombination mediator RecR [Coxiella endosymbiont of Amblyomma americanum]AJC50327.1 recombination protein RecR [Coxiella endosymbiont of Amblyomma americanum]AUJ58674.1 recombination protein RecR [Coxiella-like endosymbiont of Amblyomma americanum]
MFSPLVKQLITALQNLPGVGPKSAQRMAFHVLAKSERAKGLMLAKSLHSAISRVGECQLCRNYTEQNLCDICCSKKRNATFLCVVESPADVVAIEQAQIYSGRYFVLQGHLSPLDGIGPKEISIPVLFDRLQNESITELIIATNATVEGKATAYYIANHIDKTKIKCSRIAHGVPVGGELEYLDGGTLSHAFHARVLMKN